MADDATPSDASAQDVFLLSDLVNNLLDSFLGRIVDVADTFHREPGPAALLTFEERAQKILAQVGGACHLVGSVVAILVGDPDFRSPAMEETRVQVGSRGPRPLGHAHYSRTATTSYNLMNS